MKKDMTIGTEWKAIALFTLPIMGSNFLQVLYNVVDSVVVGRFVGTTALGAVGLTSSMVWLLVSVCTGLGAGTGIAVSQLFGAKKDREIKEVIASAYSLALVLGVLLTVLMLLLSKPIIFDLLQAPPSMREMSLTYYRIYCLGILVQLVYNVAYGILRAHGDSKGALFFLFISAVLNVVLDCIFVIVLKWSVAGAAIATVIAQTGCAVAALIYLKKLFPDLMPSKKYLYAWKKCSRMITSLSVPIVLQNMVSALGFLLLQRLVNSFGDYSIEGYTAMQKIEQIAHIPSTSLNVTISSFVGQNIGAKKLDRVQRGYKVSILMGVVTSVLLAVFVIAFDDQLLGIFGVTGESLRRGREHLDLLMVCIWISTITNITCGFLQGAGDVKIPAVSGFVNLGIRLGLSFLLAATAVDFRCFYVSIFPSWAAACLFVVLRYRSGKWKNYSIA